MRRLSGILSCAGFCLSLSPHPAAANRCPPPAQADVFLAPDGLLLFDPSGVTFRPFDRDALAAEVHLLDGEHRLYTRPPDGAAVLVGAGATLLFSAGALRPLSLASPSLAGVAFDSLGRTHRFSSAGGLLSVEREEGGDWVTLASADAECEVERALFDGQDILHGLCGNLPVLFDGAALQVGEPIADAVRHAIPVRDDDRQVVWFVTSGNRLDRYHLSEGGWTSESIAGRSDDDVAVAGGANAILWAGVLHRRTASGLWERAALPLGLSQLRASDVQLAGDWLLHETWSEGFQLYHYDGADWAEVATLFADRDTGCAGPDAEGCASSGTNAVFGWLLVAALLLALSRRRPSWSL